MPDPSGSRRSFLNPRNLGKLVSTVTGGEWPTHSPFPLGEGAGGRGDGAGGRGEEAREGWLYRVGRPAMATQFEVLFEVLDADLMPVAERALERIEELEAQLTVYRDTSEVCGINREAFTHDVEVEEGLFGLLLESKQIWEETGGAFDIAIHPLLEAWGLFRPPRRTPSQLEIESALARCGMDAVELTPLAPAPTPLPPAPSPRGEGVTLSTASPFPLGEGAGGRGVRTIRFHREGLGLNLAAVGKGYALERAAERLILGKMEHFLLQGGGSSMLARGSSTWEEGWLTGITSPLDWSAPMAHLRLENKALSTSAVDADSIRGTLKPHVLDPRTGQPVETDLVSATVCTGSASRAEGLSTAFLVMGVDKVLEYCEKHADVGAVLLRWSPGDTRFELIHTGIPKHSLEVLS